MEILSEGPVDYRGTGGKNMNGLSNIKSELLAEQTQEQIYQYILDVYKRQDTFFYI